MLYYNTICRTCLVHYDVDYAYLVINTNVEDYYKMTEYNCMCNIEEWRKADGHKCEVCKSENVEVFNIRINNYKLFTLGNIVTQCRERNEESFTLTIDKVNSKIDFKMGLHRRETIAQFAVDSLLKTFALIEKIPARNFVIHPNGYFSITMTGAIDYENETISLKTERLRYYGLSQVEIMRVIVGQHENILRQSR